MWSFTPIYENNIHSPDISAAQFHCLAKSAAGSPPPLQYVNDGILHPTIQFSDMSFFKYPHMHVKAQWVDRPHKEAAVWDAVYVTPPKADMKELMSGKLLWSSLDWKAHMVRNNLPGAKWMHMRTLCVPPDHKSHRLLVTVTPADSEKNDVNSAAVGTAVYDVKHSFRFHNYLYQLNQDKRAVCDKSRLDRVEAFLDGKLSPFVDREETRSEQLLRLSRSGLNFAKSAFSVLPIGGAFGRLVTVVYLVAKFGPLWFHTSDLVKAVSLLLRLMRSAELRYGSWWRVAASDIGLRIYYRMAEERGRRGRDPDSEYEDHLKFRTGALTDLKPLEKFCALAVHIAYETSMVDAQRLLGLQGYQLILAGRNYFLAGSMKEKEIVVIIPGTSSVADLSIDMNAFETDLLDPREDVRAGGVAGKAHGGIARAANRLATELGSFLQQLADRGFKIRIAGHSLGGGIGAVLTALIRMQVRDIHCFSFGSPPCVDSVLASWLEPVVTNIVLRDDLVCRATVKNVESLIDSLLENKTMGTYLSNDWERMKNLSFLFAKKIRPLSPQPQDAASPSPPSTFTSRWERFAALFKRKRIPEGEVRGGLFLGGKIFHIFSRNGQWFGGFLARSAPTLNRIEVQTEMLADHSGDAYFRAVTQMVQSKNSGTFWLPFSSNACACCKSDFTWSYWFTGEPHAWLARHVCRRCGSVVCNACSSRERAIPESGHLWPVRHCDRCWLAPRSSSKL